MRRYIAIPGTWGQRRQGTIDPWRDWWHPESHWSATMAILGWRPYRPDPFRWSTDLDGTWFDRLVHRGGMGDWEAAAHSLAYYCGQSLEDSGANDDHSATVAPVVIAHSHGGQVALLAIGWGLRVAGLVTIATPVRQDVLRCCRHWPPTWHHYYAGRRDWWQVLGEIGDGRIGWHRAMPAPAINHELPRGYGHSTVLTTERGLTTWCRLWLADDGPSEAICAMNVRIVRPS